MKVKISWRDCIGRGYMNTQNCPLLVSLQKLGLDVKSVGGTSFYLGRNTSNERRYQFAYVPEPGVNDIDPKRRRAPNYSWNGETLHWCARRHRSFVLEVPGLEVEFGQDGKVIR